MSNNELIANLTSSKSNEWYTPQKYIESVKRVFAASGGVIDLDPASSAAANARIGALTYYDHDGLDRPWFGNVFNNPPYGWTKVNGKNKSSQDVWNARFIEAYKMGHIGQGIQLLNSNTETKYLQRSYPYTLCFPDHRIKFDLPPGADVKDQPLKPQVFIYVGVYIYEFAIEFMQWGQISLPGRFVLAGMRDQECWRDERMEMLLSKGVSVNI